MLAGKWKIEKKYWKITDGQNFIYFFSTFVCEIFFDKNNMVFYLKMKKQNTQLFVIGLLAIVVNILASFFLLHKVKTGKKIPFVYINNKIIIKIRAKKKKNKNHHHQWAFNCHHNYFHPTKKNSSVKCKQKQKKNNPHVQVLIFYYSNKQELIQKQIILLSE